MEIPAVEADELSMRASFRFRTSLGILAGLFLVISQSRPALADETTAVRSSELGVRSGRISAGEMRAFWVDAWGKGFKTSEQTAQLVDFAAKHGFNALLLEARKRGQ